MKRRPKSKPPAGAVADVVFRLPDGQTMELPAARWVMHSKKGFRKRMPLTEYLRCLPVWLLKDVDQSELGGPGRERTSAWEEPPSALILTLQYLATWRDEPIDVACENVEHLAELTQAFRAACALEFLRRHGVLKVHVNGEDRLSVDSKVVLEMNPVVMERLKSMDPLAAPGAPGLMETLASLIPLSLKTDWADREALEDDSLK